MTLVDKKFPAAQATAARAKGAPVDPRTLITIPTDPFNENVYRLIPEEYVPPPKEVRYRSKFASQARQEYKVGTKFAASMGPAKVPVPAPTHYLKKGDGSIVQKAGSFYIYLVPKSERDRAIRKAALPAEPAPLVTPSKKDFVKQNALDNINSCFLN